MKRIVFITIMLVVHCGVKAQKKIILEDIYKNNVFRINSVRGLTWMKNGDYYTSIRTNKDGTQDIIKNSTATGEFVDIILDGSKLIADATGDIVEFSSYSFDNSETKILLSTKNERIYRRSSKSVNYIYDLTDNSLELLVEGEKQSYATFSPDGSKVAFVRNNNLFYKDLERQVLIQVTNDGEYNKIINGFADWVYEEELSLSKAFCWSPDGSKIAYLKFDESQVRIYNMQKWNGLYPEDYKYKYPKAGEKNSDVTLHIFDLETRETDEVKIGNEKDVYLARLKWLPAGQILSVIRLNRLQNTLDIFHHNHQSGETKLIYTDKSDTYIDIDQVDDLNYMNDGQSFLVSSERSGFKHLYHYSIDGQLIRQITYGCWSVIDFKGIDERRQVLYYTSTEVSSIEKHLYTVSIKGRGKKRLTRNEGENEVSFSHDFKYYINTHSNIHQPEKTTLHRSNGRVVKILSENDDYVQKSVDYGFANTEFFYVPLESGDSLNAFMMKPADFDEQKKYPVLMNVYGGPGSQRVLNSWNNNMWHHLLTQRGYIVVCVDNRGTGGKGKKFQHITYKKLGKYESEDQIVAARYLAEMPFIDQNRIGIWGWSYGGYMSSLCMMLGNDVFKAAIAVAPVTNWRFYDTIYTERYLQKPQDNPGGYDDFSPLTHVEKLQGAFLLIHGTGDDNVHFQNSVELQDALIKANKQFESFYYPDRNHSIYGGNTRLHLYTMMTKFIEKNL